MLQYIFIQHVNSATSMAVKKRGGMSEAGLHAKLAGVFLSCSTRLVTV